MEEFRSLNKGLVNERAIEVLAEYPALLQLMAHTQWIKWGLDKAFNRPSSVANLENGWAFKAHADQYPLLPPAEYESLVMGFEKLTDIEIGKYVEAHAHSSEGPSGSHSPRAS